MEAVNIIQNWKQKLSQYVEQRGYTCRISQSISNMNLEAVYIRCIKVERLKNECEKWITCLYNSKYRPRTFELILTNNSIRFTSTFLINLNHHCNSCPPSFPIKVNPASLIGARPHFQLIPTHYSNWCPPTIPTNAHPQYQLVPTLFKINAHSKVQLVPTHIYN